jgi:hypothetical protein
VAMLAVAGCQSSPPATTPTTHASTPTEPATIAPPEGKPARQWTMPNLVGVNLQQAQDQLQSLTGGALFFTSSHDATTGGRSQVVDSNWKVCSQSIAAGAAITSDSKIDFGAVKLEESCP